MSRRPAMASFLLVVLATFVACGSDDDVGFGTVPPGASTGEAAGQPDDDGSGEGGADDGDGGTTSQSGSGGTSSKGGSGGTSSKGGAGGTSSKGGAGGGGGAGGTSAKGGASGAGGTTSKGGSGGSGGTTSKGGASGSGGTTSKGGSGGSGGTASKGGSGGTSGKGGAGGSGGTTGKGGSGGSGGTSGKGGAGGTGASGGSGGSGGGQAGCQGTWLPIPPLAVNGALVDPLAATYADDVVYVTYVRPGDPTFVDAAYFGRGAQAWTIASATAALLTDPDVSGYAPSYGPRGLYLVEGKLVYAYNVNYPAFDSPRATTFDLTTKTWATTPGAYNTSAGASVAVGARTLASYGGLFGELYDAGPCYDTATTVSIDLVTGKTTGGQSSVLGEREDAFGTYVDGRFFFFGGQKRQYRSNCNFPEDKPKTIANGAFFDPLTGTWGDVLASADFLENPVALVASADRAVLVGDQVCTAKAGESTLDCFVPKGSPVNYYPPYSRHTHFGVADGVFEFFWEGTSAHFLDLATQTRTLLCPAPAPLATYPDSSSPPRFSAGEGRKGAVYARAGGYFVTF